MANERGNRSGLVGSTNPTIKNRRFSIIASTLFVLVLLASYVGAGEPILKFRAVETEHNCRELKGYICGKEVYKDYEYQGLPLDFAIKKEADLVITSRQIKDIKITRRQYGKYESWELHILFTEEGAKKIEAYTAANLKKRVAIEAGNEILSVPTILMRMTSEMVLQATKKDIENMGKILQQIYPAMTRDTIIETPTKGDNGGRP